MSQARRMEGVVVGRGGMEHLWIRNERGVTVDLRVLPEVGARFDLGQEVRVVADAHQTSPAERFPARCLDSRYLPPSVEIEPRRHT